ncbi:hypothetical protein M3Y99_00029800 [Aphelenchoides fujianensis]|nr:hypothetical protein M3Y99_00029800 [Aphelenchoides fujianensis]
MPREDREAEAERKAKTPYDLARYRLQKLNENPDKLAPIPVRREEAKPREPPEFVRNVVGSSAAAGSAEFHIYRNNRRKEMNRLDHMEQEYQQQKLDEEYRQRVDERRRLEEEKLEKNRRKRQRQKGTREAATGAEEEAEAERGRQFGFRRELQRRRERAEKNHEIDDSAAARNAEEDEREETAA